MIYEQTLCSIKISRFELFTKYVPSFSNSTVFIYQCFSRSYNLVISALSSDTYVETAANANNLILYPRLFEEIQTIL